MKNEQVLEKVLDKIVEINKATKEETLEEVSRKMVEISKATKEETLEEVTRKIVEINKATKEEILEEVSRKMVEVNKETKEEILEEVTRKIVETKEELASKMDKRFEKVEDQMKKDKNELQGQIKTIQKEQGEFRAEMREQLHNIKEVNLSSIIGTIAQTRIDLKSMENRLASKIEVANMQCKNKVAN